MQLWNAVLAKFVICDEIKDRSSNLIGAWALQNLALYLPCSVPMLVIRGQTNVVWLVSHICQFLTLFEHGGDTDSILLSWPF